MEERKVSPQDMSIDMQLRTLYALQQVDSKRDAIRALRGELPLEVEDLETEIEGLQARTEKLQGESKDRADEVTGKKLEIKDAEALIKRYTEQQKNVRNNREFDALSKELEYQKLVIELCNKQIKECKVAIEGLADRIEQTKQLIEERTLDLQAKQQELDTIIRETAVEESELEKESERLLAMLPKHLRTGYSQIRANSRNGLAVVDVVRNSCGGCFNRIPPQRQLDIRLKKKLIICEYCGRIIVSGPEVEPEEE
ncbi:MAG: hypothetical protein CSA97_00015 [Bacteroidetes bacterium]|nr:MAG: hypothetical protein CSA97_00015 [Bacteroidota bacterium]